jgi:hypothetical protein
MYECSLLNDGNAKQLANKDAHSSKVWLIWQRGIFAKMFDMSIP